MEMDTGDAAAIALARVGDRDAFRLLVERHSRRVFRLAYRLTGNEEDAEDIVQETFLRAYKNLDRFDGRAHLTSWLFRIASNCALNLLRTRKKGPTQSLSVADAEDQPITERIASLQPGPERLVMSAEVQRRIGSALDELTPQERVAFTLRHFEGREIEEISEILGVGGNATRHAVFRAVQKMRRALEPVAGDSR
jgi:RNA polymerase sigma-70 factor (ECF subfamily)